MTPNRVKIAYVGSHLPSYYAYEHDVFGRSFRGLSTLAQAWDFELISLATPVVSADDAYRASQELEAAQVDMVLLQNSTFAMGDVVTQFANRSFRLGLWAVEEPTQVGPVLLNNFVSLQLNAGILRHFFRFQAQPHKWFFGFPGHPWFDPRLKVSVAALKALKTLRQARVALIGGVAPTFFNFIQDHRKLLAKLGVVVEELELEQVFKRMVSSPQHLQPIMQNMVAQAQGRLEISARDLELSASIFLAMQQLAQEGRYSALAVSDWPRFQSELDVHPGMAFSWLDETAGIPVASEGDVLGAVTMLLLRSVSGSGTMLLDLTDIDWPSQSLLAWHCGGSPLNLANSNGVTWKNHSTLGRKVPGAQPKGAVADLVFAPQPVTLARIGQDTEQLFVAEAEVFEGPSLGFDGSRGWLHNFSIQQQPTGLADMVNTLLVHGIEHHFGLAAGQHSEVLGEIAAWSGLRIATAIPYRNSLQIPPHKEP